MNGERCPECGAKLVRNGYGDLVCPNCGIVEHHREETKERPSYCG